MCGDEASMHLIDEILTLRKETYFEPPTRRTELFRKMAGKAKQLIELVGCTFSDMQNDDILKAGVALLFVEEARKEGAVFIFSWRPKKDVCMKLMEHETEIKEFYELLLLELQKEVLEDAVRTPSRLHRERRRALDQVIQTLLQLKPSAEVCLTLAKAYLYRSQIIRPRGFTVPGRKLEALRKASQWLDEAKAKGADERECWRVKALISLELERVGEMPVGLKEVLEKAVKLGALTPAERPEDQLIVLRFCELTDPKCLTGQVKSTLEDFVDNLHLAPLSQARAARLISHSSLACKVKKAIEDVSRRRFSDPSWELLVDLLQDLAKRGDPCWKEAAKEAWEACRKAEVLIRNNCHLRWYWSRQRALYDLAFAAEDDPEEKAKIADSLKSRPALRRTVFDEMAPEFVEMEAKAYTGSYIKGLSYIPASTQGTPGNEQISIPVAFINVPDKWAVIHYYISSDVLGGKTEKQGYALIYDKINGWTSEGPFTVKNLWTEFYRWHENYALYGEHSENVLRELCKQIGKCMPFLFDKKWQGMNFLFVPHDFLHRLPLHMALKCSGNHPTPVITEHKCAYLPAWWLWKPDETPNLKGKKILLKKFDEFKYDKLWNLTFWDFKKDEAMRDDVLKVEDDISLLCLLCHGHADYVNPYNSGLKLQDGCLCHRDLLQSNVELKGSKVILGACETDLMAPAQNPVDEHLSVSSAFLEKGASEVLGTLYKVRAVDIEDLAKIVCENLKDPMWNILDSYYEEYFDVNNLFAIAAFRVIGFNPYVT